MPSPLAPQKQLNNVVPVGVCEYDVSAFHLSRVHAMGKWLPMLHHYCCRSAGDDDFPCRAGFAANAPERFDDKVSECEHPPHHYLKFCEIAKPNLFISIMHQFILKAKQISLGTLDVERWWFWLMDLWHGSSIVWLWEPILIRLAPWLLTMKSMKAFRKPDSRWAHWSFGHCNLQVER